MKTRQEMVYDFMIALSSNSGVFTYWNSCEFFELGGYGEHIKSLAEELVDEYLQENT
jgi:hypothetical protein